MRNRSLSFEKSTFYIHFQSPGVLLRSKEQRRESREQLIREYYDGPKGNYYPYSFEISFDSVEIYKIGAPSLPDSALPIGMVQEDTQTKIVQIQVIVT